MKEEYYKTKATVKEYIVATKGFDGRELIDELKKVLLPNSLVLELGSGPGTDWNILSETYSVIGSDNSNEFLDHLNNKFPKGAFLNLDASKLETDKKFDGIFANKVLHHLNDGQLITSIKRQHEILNPDGIICHSFWKGEGSEVFKGLFVNYHTQKRLINFFQEYFEIVSIQEYAEFEKNDSILLLGKKKSLSI